METRKYNRCIILFVLAFALVKCEVEKDSEDQVFVPTHEWQPIKEGQKVPPGLHLRIDFQTGEKHAKLLDETQEETNAVQSLDTSEAPTTTVTDHLKVSELRLKEALKNIKGDDIVESETETLKTFKSYEQIKQELSDLDLNPKTESEVLKELIDRFIKIMKEKTIDTVEILTLFEDLDFLIHQVDNAIEFVRLKGFEEVIYKNINSTVTEIKLETLKLLGSIVQNNVKVQIYALETGSLDLLLRTLVLNTNKSIKNRAIFALGGLIRHFPYAQLKFVQNAGLNVFTEIFSHTDDLKIQLKIVTLINDLVLEHLDALDDLTYTEKIAQYRKIDLKRKLHELDWCKYLTTLLKNVYQIDKNDHEGLETSLSAILSVEDGCNTSDINNIQHILEELQVHYKNLISAAVEAGDDFDIDYYKHLESICSSIIDYNKISNRLKVEL